MGLSVRGTLGLVGAADPLGVALSAVGSESLVLLGFGPGVGPGVEPGLGTGWGPWTRNPKDPCSDGDSFAPCKTVMLLPLNDQRIEMKFPSGL